MELAKCRVCGENKVKPLVVIDIGIGKLVRFGDKVCEDCAEKEDDEKENENVKLPF